MNYETNDFTDYLIVGAGVAGLALAGDLVSAGKTVRVLDKGRSVGGRCATRRFADGVIADHGAQYFTAQNERFVAWVNEWLAEPDSALREWNRGFPAYQNGVIVTRTSGHPRYAPTTGMSSIAKRLASGLDVRLGITVSAITRTEAGWEVTDGTQTFAAQRLCLTLPPEQLLTIAANFLPDDARVRLAAVHYDPAWTLIIRLSTDIALSYPAMEFKDHPVLGFLSRDHTKRATQDAPVLVVHAAGAWSRENQEANPDMVQAVLLNALQDVLGEPLLSTEVQLHRWRYALPQNTFGAPFFMSEDAVISVCGDGCGGIRLENALATGWQLAAVLRAHS